MQYGGASDIKSGGILGEFRYQQKGTPPMGPRIISDDASLTFTDYFRLNIAAEDVVTEFGYAFESRTLDWPRTPPEPSRLEGLKSRIVESLPYLSLTSEISRRGFLIAPVILEVVHHTHVRVRTEYPVNVDNRLRGTLDYLLQADGCVVVVEAKNADLERGFTQLAVELIALDHWLENELPEIVGAVSIGNVWQFGRLDRAAKHIVQDLNLYRVPTDLSEVLAILIGSLAAESVATTSNDG